MGSMGMPSGPIATDPQNILEIVLLFHLLKWSQEIDSIPDVPRIL